MDNSQVSLLVLILVVNLASLVLNVLSLWRKDAQSLDVPAPRLYTKQKSHTEKLKPRAKSEAELLQDEIDGFRRR